MCNTEKSCSTCSGRFKGCMLKEDIIDTSCISDSIECKIEDGLLHEVITEQLDLTEVFLHMQDKGIIKKNVNIKEIAKDDNIISLMSEAITDCVTHFVRNKLSDVEPTFEFNVDDNFSCSMWQ